MALCLLVGGTAIIAGACGLLARGYLMGQADQQLRSYAGRLVSRPFVVSPLYGFTPGAQGADGPGGGAVGIEVRGSAGQLVMRAAPRARPGQVIPPVPAAVAARAGQPVTVAAGNGGSWRMIAEPIHYRTWRIPFSYSAEGFAVLITSRARKGRVGTLVVGLDLDGINRAVRGLAIGALAVRFCRPRLSSSWSAPNRTPSGWPGPSSSTTAATSSPGRRLVPTRATSRPGTVATATPTCWRPARRACSPRATSAAAR
jgi:hypothetical protein